MGYPLVTFSRTAVAGQWSVTQERFLTSGQLEGVDPALPPARYWAVIGRWCQYWAVIGRWCQY